MEHPSTNLGRQLQDSPDPANDAASSPTGRLTGVGRIALSAQPARSTGAGAIGALAVGACAFGAIAIGAIAIGRLAIGGMAVRRGRIRTLTVDELRIGRLHVRELVIDTGLDSAT
jgi:hypothetical protein